MSIDYNLNLALYELGVVLINTRRWKGLLELEPVLKQYESQVGPTVFEMFRYGIELTTNGLDPEMLEFLMIEKEEQLKFEVTDSYELMKDLRLVMQFIKWIHQGEFDGHQKLLQLFVKDTELLSLYRYWTFVNQFKLDLMFKTFITLDQDEIQQIMSKNQEVKKHYDQNTDEHKAYSVRI